MIKIMKKVFAGLIVIAGATASLLYDYHCTGNCVTMLAGLWSAVATAVLGGVAYWQNKKYKQLADQQNDLAFMPDLYISTALTDAVSGSAFSSLSKVRGIIDGIETCTCAPIKLWFLKGPIINLKVTEIQHGEESWVCTERAGMTFRDESVPFPLVVDIPTNFDQRDNLFVAVLKYENIYGTIYQKEIRFTVEAGQTSPDVQELKKARRIDNGQA